MQERGTSSLSEIKVLAPFRRRDCGERPASSTLHSLLILPEIYYQLISWMAERVGGRRAVSPLAVGCAATAERDQTYQCASRTTSEVNRSPAYLDLNITEAMNQLNDP